jgi:hypothetical protein
LKEGKGRKLDGETREEVGTRIKKSCFEGFCPAWWCMPVIPAFGRQRQEDHEFKASLGCIAKLSLKTNKGTQTSKCILFLVFGSILHLSEPLFNENI